MISVVIATELRADAEALSWAISAHEALNVEATVTSELALLRCLSRSSPDVVVLSGTSWRTPLIAVQSVQRLSSGSRIVAFGVQSGTAAIEWARSGAQACLGPDASLEDLVTAIIRASDGEVTCSAAIATELFRALGDGPTDEATAALLSKLTQRETQIFELVCQRLSNKEIAQILRIEVPTVKNHVHSIFGKLGIASRNDAIRFRFSSP